MGRGSLQAAMVTLRVLFCALTESVIAAAISGCLAEASRRRTDGAGSGLLGLDSRQAAIDRKVNASDVAA